MINLNDLIKAANGQLFGDAAAQLFSEFVFDAARAHPSTLFVALRTARRDTHHDITEAVANGAVGLLCNAPPDEHLPGVTIIIVRDTVDALLAWTRYVLGRAGVRIVAVAGGAAHSITAHTVTAVLGRQFNVCEDDVDVDGLLALPVAVSRLKPETEWMILRLTPDGPDQIKEIVAIAHPNVVILTELDDVVTAAFDSQQQYLEEYVLLLQSLSPGDLIILSFDDDLTRELASQTRAQVRTISVENFGADMMATNVILGADRTGFDLRYDQQREVGRWTPTLGRQQLRAVLASLLVGVEMGIDLRDSLRALSQLAPLPGRMRPLNGRGGMQLIDDTHHATMASTMAALDWLAEVRAEGRRTTLVMADLDDLGGGSAFVHRAIGARAAGAVDFLITLGSEAALVSRSAIDARMPQRHIRTCYGVQDAINAVLSLEPSDEDVVLVIGGALARAEQVVRGLLAHAQDSALLVRQDGAPAGAASRQLRPSWKEIDMDALGRNVSLVRASLAEDVTLMAVVKADGYGHGAVQSARVALANGAGYLAVANIAEALELRDAGISAPILILTYTPASAVRLAIAQNLTATIYDTDIAQHYDRAARASGGRLRVHVKVDTGMGRLGLPAASAVQAFRLMHSMRHLDIEGVYTHFATADDDPNFVQQQLGSFKQLIRFLKAGGFEIRYYHAANSPATLLSDELHLNMVRPGVILYGLDSSRLVKPMAGIQPVMSWKTSVLQVKQLPPGHSVGYGRTYITRGHETVAVLPVGYADGLRRSPYTWKEVLIHGQRAPLIGRVSMEKCVVNVSHIEGVSAGDEVVLLGRQGYDRITAEEVALWLGTINYEVTTSILARQAAR